MKTVSTAKEMFSTIYPKEYSLVHIPDIASEIGVGDTAYDSCIYIRHEGHWKPYITYFISSRYNICFESKAAAFPAAPHNIKEVIDELLDTMAAKTPILGAPVKYDPLKQPAGRMSDLWAITVIVGITIAAVILLCGLSGEYIQNALNFN